MRVHQVDVTLEPGADDVVGVTVEDRRDESLQLFGRVLAIGIAERDSRGVERHRRCESGAHRGAEPTRRLADDTRSRAFGLGGGVIA